MSTESINLSELLELAERATKGPWRVSDRKGWHSRITFMEEIVPEYSPAKSLLTISGTAWRPQRGKSVLPTAKYIAACSPDRIQALVRAVVAAKNYMWLRNQKHLTEELQRAIVTARIALEEALAPFQDVRKDSSGRLGAPVDDREGVGK